MSDEGNVDGSQSGNPPNEPGATEDTAAIAEVNNANANTRNQRRRIVPPTVEEMNLVPVDRALISSNVCTRIRTLASLNELTTESSRMEQVRTDTRYVDLQLLRIVMPAPDRSTALIYSRSSRNRANTRGKGKEQTYGRMYLARIYDKLDAKASGEMVYLLQGEHQNNRLWQRDNQMRDNGTLSIGCYFRILCPEFVTNYVNNETPLISTLRPAILMETPTTIPSVRVQNLGQDQSRAFVLNSANLFVQGIQVIESPCNGNVCDKQRIHELKGGKCSCYSWKDLKSRCVFNHNIIISHLAPANHQPLKIWEEHYTSQKFSQLYLTKPVPNNVRLAHMQDSNEYFDIRECVQEMCDYVNLNGGWTVVGWYSLGMVTDKALVNNNNETEAKVEAGETKHHIISVYPTRESFRTPNHDDYKALNDNKYNTDNMNA